MTNLISLLSDEFYSLADSKFSSSDAYNEVGTSGTSSSLIIKYRSDSDILNVLTYAYSCSYLSLNNDSSRDTIIREYFYSLTKSETTEQDKFRSNKLNQADSNSVFVPDDYDFDHEDRVFKIIELLALKPEWFIEEYCFFKELVLLLEFCTVEKLYTYGCFQYMAHKDTIEGRELFRNYDSYVMLHAFLSRVFLRIVDTKAHLSTYFII